jgi:hypothetical protein
MLELNSPLRKVIDIFKRTRFAFVPIISTPKEDNNDKHNNGIENCNRDCIRNKDQGSTILNVVNDRTIMEFLLSHKKREMFNPSFGSVSDLDMIHIDETKNDITVREAALYLMGIRNPFLVLEGKNSIITPWDLVLRTIGRANQ